jgi:tRNA threonylcarbamoyladenosine biosynthesis protein TsaE
MIHIKTDTDMKAFGQRIGARLRGGELFELIGDVGAGKTTLAKGIGAGLGIEEAVQSPSFTISRVYDARDALRLIHYDFYRLDDAGVMRHELAETLHDPRAITLIEWSQTVQDILPEERVKIIISSDSQGSGRHVECKYDTSLAYLFEAEA